MSELTTPQIESLNVACPRCRAPKGQLCVMRSVPHPERVEWLEQHRRELQRLREWNQACAEGR